MHLPTIASIFLLAFLQISYCSAVDNFNEIGQDQNNNWISLLSLVRNNALQQKDTVEQCPITDMELLGLSHCELMQRIVMLEDEIESLTRKSTSEVTDKSGPSRNKRKNEFIRFGKRSAGDNSALPEMLRFTKTMSPSLSISDMQIPANIQRQSEKLSLKKRKNEFIRFG
uniref:Uncharacterized protein n=1 Tax=Ditylenchus dipsaci TaxID=166011 RepID=A0A915CSI9_9BILA